MRWKKNRVAHTTYKYEPLTGLISNGFIICGIYSFAPCLIQVEDNVITNYHVLPMEDKNDLIRDSIYINRDLEFTTIFVDEYDILSTQNSIDNRKLVLQDLSNNETHKS